MKYHRFYYINGLNNINSLSNTRNIFGNTSLMIRAFSILGAEIYFLKKETNILI